MPLFAFASDKRRIRYQQKLDRQRATRKSIRGQLETLEDRKLMAVDMNPALFGQLYTNGSSANGVTQTVERTIPLLHGADAAIAISASYTDTNAIFPFIDVTVDGVSHTYAIPPVVGAFADASGPYGGAVAEGQYQALSVSPPSTPINGSTTLNAFTIVIPVGSASMDRNAFVRLRGGISTDFVATAGPVYGVSQANPVDDSQGAFSPIVFGSTVSNSAGLVLPNVVNPGNMTFDAILGIQRQPTNALQLLTNLQADPLAGDTSDGLQQQEFFESAVVTSTSLGAVLRGAASRDNDTLMNWGLTTSAGAWVQSAVEINMANPGTPVFYDAGDAPDTYGTTIANNGAIHAPKGPLLGLIRDTELNGQPNVGANGDDLNGSLTGTTATGSLVFGGFAINSFDPGNGGVPVGARQVAVGPNINSVVEDPDLAVPEFQYLNGANGINVDIDEDTISLLEFPINGYSGGLNSWVVNLTNLSANIVGANILNSNFGTSLSIVTTPTGVQLVFDGSLNQVPAGRSVTLQLLNSLNDDEDGVGNLRTNGNVLPPVGGPGNSLLGGIVSQSMANNTASVDVQVSGLLPGQTGYVTIYVDWQRDGSFAQAADLVQAGVAVAANGVATYTFNVPTSANIVPGDSYMRVRLHTAPMGAAFTLAPTGHANDGEVEDYKISLVRGTEIHGIKFEDLNNNGVRDVGEPPMAGVAMSIPLTDDIWGNQVPISYSNANGEFWFVNLGGGQSYNLSEDLAKTDINNDKLWDSNPTNKIGPGFSIGTVPVDQGLRRSTPDVTTKVLAQGEILNDVLFGNYITGSLHGVKFNDANGNGVWDVAGGELPAKGVSFDLWKYTGVSTQKFVSNKTVTTYTWTKISTETSDIHGEFWFMHLDPGTYELREQKGPYIQTTTQPTSDLNAKVSATQFGLNPADSKTTFEIVSRREYVWQANASKHPKDWDNNGLLTADEIAAGIADAALKVEVLATPGVDAAPANQNQDLWFGNLFLATVTGFKYEDVNRNGSFGAPDVGLDNVKMTLTGTDIFGKAVTLHTLTSGGGNFTFSGVVPGSYSVSENVATDSNKDGKADNIQDMVLDSKVVPVTLKSGQTIDLWNDLAKADKHKFANYVYGSIHGVKFIDLNANGKKDLNESFAKDFAFDLYRYDKSTSKTTSSGATKTTYIWSKIASTTSDLHGEFWFTQLDPGTYEVVEAGKTDWIQSTGQPTKDPNIAVSTATQQGLNPADSKTNFDIVSRREYVWEAGASKRAIDGMGGPLDGFIDANEVTFGLNKGALKNEVLATPAVDAAPAEESQDLWFGNYQLGKINGFKYEDIDNNAKFDGADVGLDNVKMTLTGTDGFGKAVTLHTLTSGGGNFSFPNLIPGNYTVFENGLTDTNKDGVADNLQEMVLDGIGLGVQLQSGQIEDTSLIYKFRNFVLGSIHGVKFVDTNANGKWDSGEVAGKDFEFDLYKYDKATTKTTSSGATKTTYMWTKVTTGKSDLHGEFWFTGLEPGTYEVVEAAKSGWGQSTSQPSKNPNAAVSTTTQAGLNPATSTSKFDIVSRREFVWEAGASKRAIDGMGGPLDGFIDAGEVTFGLNKAALKVEVLATPGVDAAPADKSQDLWFGNFAFATVTGFKYEDVNRDGSFNGTDVGLDNVKMTLTGTDGAGKAVTLHTLTGGGGNFTFTGLVPGSYSVSENTASDSNKDGKADNIQDMVLDAKVVPVTLKSGQTIDLWNDLAKADKHKFANYVYGSIHGVKFIDADANGVWDKNFEVAGKDFVFDLYKYDKATTKTTSSNTTKTTYLWTKVASSTSDLHGEFWFTQLDPGTYQVVEASKAGWIQSTDQPTKDPNAAVSTTTQQGLNPADSKTNFNIVSRREYVWEAGASKRAIDGMGGPLDGFIDGNEVTFGLNKGALKNEVLAPPLFVNPNELQDLWFGNFQLGVITGFKYEDVNFNGKFDGVDVGLDNVKMTLVGTDGFGKAVTLHTLTSGGGNFSFTGLVPGDYELSENVETDTNKDGVADIQQDMVLDQGGVIVKLLSGETVNTADVYKFGNFVYGSIHGVKFIDTNANGKWDSGESAGKDFVFDLYKYDTSTTKTTSSGATKTTYMWTKVSTGKSDLHGEFWFTQLEPGTYEVVEAAKSGWAQSTSQPSKDPNVAVSTTTQLGLNPATSTTKFDIVSRREFVWEAGATKRAIDGMGGPLDGLIDAAEVTFGLNHGALKVEVLATPGVDAAPADKSQDLWFGNFAFATVTGFKYEDVDRNGSFGGSDVGLDNVKMTLTGTDGAGKAVTLHTLTSGGGNFTFTGLVPGNYSVSENVATDSNKDGKADNIQDMVLDAKVVPVTLKSGQTIDLWNDLAKADKHKFANYVYGSIHGVKFIDLNANGKRDSVEAAGKDFVFDLYKYDKATTKTTSSGATKTTYLWTKVASTTSDIHGEFWFTQLDPGTYEVVEAGKVGWIQSTGQSTKDPNIAVSTTTQQGLNPVDSKTNFDIVSRREYVWEAGASKRAIDGMGGPLDGFIDAAEVTFGLNKGALKNEVLATPAVDAAPANENQDLWFGNYQLGSISGFKYEDIDGNGKFDGVDVGLDNVKMTLIGTAGTGKDVTLHTLTSGGGNFSFTGLVPGFYTVFENELTDTNKDGVADKLQDLVLDGIGLGITLQSGQAEDTSLIYKFRNFVLGSIHGVKFVDTNANGKWDSGEVAGKDFEFDLYKYDKATTKTTTSGATKTTYMWTKVSTGKSDLHGEFWFTGLEPGTYEVVEAAKSGWGQSTSQPSKNPNAAVSTATQAGLNPATSTSKFDIVSRREFVWEAGASKRAIDGMGGPLDGFIDAGEVTFGLNKAALKVEVLATPGVDAAPADKSQDLWFGNFAFATVTGFKYEDVNRDGSFGGTDVGLDNVKMTLTGTDGLGKAVTLHTLTSGGGNFTFTGLVPGSYSVSENVATDSNKDGKADNIQDMVLDAKVVPVTLKSGQTIDLWNDLGKADKHRFANYVYGSIHGVKFIDTNANGKRDSGELIGKDFVFDLYKFDKATTKTTSSNTTKTTYLWTKVASSTSDIHGEFWFTQLDPGIYEVVEVAKTDWIQSTTQPTKDPNIAVSTTTQQGLNPADSKTNFDIVSRREYVWEAGASKRAIDGMGGPLDGFIDGSEVTFGLNKGALKVEVLATPAVDAAPADELQDLWFGNYQLGAVTGFKYEDVNFNGKFDAGDVGLDNVKMTLIGQDGTGKGVTLHTLTSGGGNFTFAGLVPGKYEISENAETDTNKDGVADVFQDMIVDSTIVGAIVKSGETVDTSKEHKFANFVFGSIHGVKFVDTNANGKWDSGESAGKDFVFDLYKYDTSTTKTTSSGATKTTYMWTKVSTGKSDLHGEFWFTQLEPGTYEVVEAAKSGWGQSTSQPSKDPNVAVSTTTQLGLNPATSTTKFDVLSRREFVWEAGATKRAIDGMGGPLDGLIDAAEVTFGLNHGALKVEVLATPGVDAAPADKSQDLWFGNFAFATVTGFKYEDVNRDGSFGGADVGLDNVKMTLTGTDGAGKAVTLHTLTSGGGNFTFTGLVPGSYSVSENTASDSNKDGKADNIQDMVLDAKVVPVTLKSGQTIDLWNDLAKADKHKFANYVYGSIHGVKFIDTNANGKRDSGELIGKDFVFDLYKFDKATTKTTSSNTTKTTYLWTKVASSTSDIHGEFWFTQLDPGIYEVVEVAKTDWIQSTTQPTKDPNIAVSTTTQQGLNPADSKTNFDIVSRREYVWEAGASKRAIDGMGGPLDGFIDAAEVTFGLNKGALKVEVLATPAIDAAPADENQDLWFGNYQLGAITGFKYEDVDKDGSFGGADVGLDNVKMTLIGEDGFGKVVTLHTLTSGGGNFTFSGLVPGKYEIAENTATDTNKDGKADNIQDMVLDGKVVGAVVTSGKNVNLWNDLPTGQKHKFANYVYGSIHGVKFIDANANGKWDSGELAGKEFEFDLYKYDTSTTKTTSSGATKTTYMWTKVSTGKSDLHGEFWFTQLDPGTYEVVEVAKSGWGQSTSQPSKNPNVAVSSATQLGLNPATSTTKFDIVSRREFVWEAGASKRAIDGMGGPLDGFIDAAEVTFGLNKGALKVEVLATPGADAAPADKSQDLWFGNFAFATVTGFKYEDVNRDGSFGGSDVGLDNVKMTLTGTDGLGKAVTLHTLTSGGGNFTFTGLVPGSYSVSENVATDTNKDGKADNIQDMVLDTKVVPVTLKSGQTIDLWNDLAKADRHKFANYVYGSIHGVKFLDFNKNGDWDKTGNAPGSPLGPFAEPALPGVEFDLYKFNKSTSKQVSSGSTITKYYWDLVGSSKSDVHGEFWFTQLNPGTYTVREKIAGGLFQTTDQKQGNPNAGNGENPLSANNFEIISRREYVWEAGATKRAIDGMGGPLDGFIDAAEVAAGLNHGALKNEILSPANGQPDLVFGNNYITGSLHGFKFEDINGDHQFNATEPGMANVQIEIRDSKGALAFLADGSAAVTGTNNDGSWSIAGLIPGAYTVHENLLLSDTNFDFIPDAKQGLVQSTKTAPAVVVGPDQAMVWKAGASFSKNEVVVGSQLTIGNYVTGSIHGFKFLDLNADGKYDPSAMGKETPFAGVVFEVLDSKGASVGTATTNAAGEFWFNDLLPGTYTLQERLDLVDKNGNSIPDNKEGLAASTKSSIQLTIKSREELVWKNGAAMLPGTQTLAPDGFFPLVPIPPFVGPSATATLSMAGTGNPVFNGVAPDGNQVYAYFDGLNYPQLFQATPGQFLQADFTDPANFFPFGVDQVSIDIIADNNGDIGQLVAFDAFGSPITAVQTGVLTAGQVQKLTVNALPGGSKIYRIQAAGLGGIVPMAVRLDNLQYTVNPLKKEVLVGDQLYFGNYYSGAIHGLKLQQGTNLPAPNLPFSLIDAWAKVVGTTTTDATGHFWFNDVKPGSYTVVETATPSVISKLPSIPVVVGHAEAVFATDIPAVDRMFHVGLQTPVDNHALTIHNLILGSIHGTVATQTGAPVVGVPVAIIAGPTPGSTVTDGVGEFDFENLIPGTYVLQIGGTTGQVRVITVSSGEEEVGKAGQSQLDPGQYESAPNNDLNIVVFVADVIAPKIAGVRLNSSNWTQGYRDLIDTDSKGAGTGVGFKIPTGAAQGTPWSWNNVNQIIVEFTEDVRGSGPGGTLIPADFAILGVNNIAYTISSISYNPATFRATLNLANFLPRDKYLVTANDLTLRDTSGNFLDGEFTNYTSTMPTGNGTQNGIFNYRFNVSPGNYDLSTDGFVATLDLGTIGPIFGSLIGGAGYNKHADTDGDGIIATLDLSVVGINFGQGLPAGSPGGFAQVSGGSGGALAGEGEGSGSLAGLLADDNEQSYSAYGEAVDSIFALDDEDEDELNGELEYSLYDDLL